MPFPDEIKARMLGQNALDWLGPQHPQIASLMTSNATTGLQ
jgi:aminocarboxymuconate-semialdehyde decarboxylase